VKRKPTTRAPAEEPAAVVRDAKDVISFNAAKKLIAACVRETTDSNHSVRDRVAKQLSRAAASGELSMARNRTFVVSDLANWARRQYPENEKLAALPSYNVISVPLGEQRLTGFAPTISYSPESKRIAELETENERLRAELEACRVDAEKWRDHNRKSGKRGHL
jgi:hypothetical protein